MKPIDVKLSKYTDFDVEKKNKYLNSKFSDQVRISKYKIIFAKGYAQNCSEEVLVIKKC